MTQYCACVSYVCKIGATRRRGKGRMLQKNTHGWVRRVEMFTQSSTTGGTPSGHLNFTSKQVWPQNLLMPFHQITISNLWPESWNTPVYSWRDWYWETHFVSNFLVNYGAFHWPSSLCVRGIHTHKSESISQTLIRGWHLVSCHSIGVEQPF